MQPHWVGDLTLETNLEVTQVAPGASVRVELVKAGLAHGCTIDLGTGSAVLTRGEQELAKWETPIKGPGRYPCTIRQRRRTVDASRRWEGNGWRRILV